MLKIDAKKIGPLRSFILAIFFLALSVGGFFLAASLLGEEGIIWEILYILVTIAAVILIVFHCGFLFIAGKLFIDRKEKK
ncbi:hypothetical protein H8E50_03615 [bacterium]|nr:hypothetical protein [bacterium]